MSHVATVKVTIQDLDALRAACKAAGLEFREGQKTYRWWGTSVGDYPLPEGMTVADLGKCDHAIGIPGNDTSYEIGVVRRGTSYILAWDFYAGGKGLEKVAGKNCGRLVQAYSMQVASKAALKSGYRMTGTKTNADGSVEMVFVHA